MCAPHRSLRVVLVLPLLLLLLPLHPCRVLAMHPSGLPWQLLAAVAAAQGCAGRCMFHGASRRPLHAPTAGRVPRGVGGCGPHVWA